MTMKPGVETGSLVNYLYSGMTGQPEPAVGMGVTILYWTDRVAGTITEVTDKSFTVREDDWKRLDRNGISERQDYEFTPNPNGSSYVFKRVSRGKAKGQWRENGRKDGNSVLIGKREKYEDPCF